MGLSYFKPPAVHPAVTAGKKEQKEMRTMRRRHVVAEPWRWLTRHLVPYPHASKGTLSSQQSMHLVPVIPPKHAADFSLHRQPSTDIASLAAVNVHTTGTVFPSGMGSERPTRIPESSKVPVRVRLKEWIPHLGRLLPTRQSGSLSSHPECPDDLVKRLVAEDA